MFSDKEKKTPTKPKEPKTTQNPPNNKTVKLIKVTFPV